MFVGDVDERGTSNISAGPTRYLARRACGGHIRCTSSSEAPSSGCRSTCRRPGQLIGPPMWCARIGHTRVPGRGDNSEGRSVHRWSVRGRVGSPGRTTCTCRACVARSSGTAVPRQSGRRPVPGRRSGRRDAGGRDRVTCSGCRRCRCLHGRQADPPPRNARTSCDASAYNSGHRYWRHPGGTAGLFVLRTGGSASVARQDVRRPGHREGRAVLTARWPPRRSMHQDGPGGIPRARKHAPVTASTPQSGWSAIRCSRREVAAPVSPRCPQACAPRSDVSGAS